MRYFAQIKGVKCHPLFFPVLNGNSAAGNQMSGNTNYVTKKVCGVLFGAECGIIY